MADLNEDKIRERAFDLYLQRGCADGLALNDWINAEQQLLHEQAPEPLEPVFQPNTRTMKAGAGRGD